MKTTVTLYASWWDPKLENLTSNFEKVNILGNFIDRVWKPDIYFTNGKDVAFDTVPSEGKTITIFNGNNMTGVYYISRFAYVSYIFCVT